MSLDPNSENTHIPYRDSKLTRVLQNSLGGNSYTIVLAAIHPHASHYEECLSTLQFANRCRNVKNNPKVNYVDDPSDKDTKIKRLVEEVAMLRSKLASAEKGMSAETVMRKGGKISPAKLVEILKRLGMNAGLSADGGLLVNGERFEIDGLGLEEEQDDDDPSISGDDDSGLNFALAGKVNKKKIRMIVSELMEANRNHSLKSKERKVGAPLTRTLCNHPSPAYHPPIARTPPPGAHAGAREADRGALSPGALLTPLEALETRLVPSHPGTPTLLSLARYTTATCLACSPSGRASSTYFQAGQLLTHTPPLPYTLRAGLPPASRGQAPRRGTGAAQGARRLAP